MLNEIQQTQWTVRKSTYNYPYNFTLYLSAHHEQYKYIYNNRKIIKNAIDNLGYGVGIFRTFLQTVVPVPITKEMLSF